MEKYGETTGSKRRRRSEGECRAWICKINGRKERQNDSRHSKTKSLCSWSRFLWNEREACDGSLFDFVRREPVNSLSLPSPHVVQSSFCEAIFRGRVKRQIEETFRNRSLNLRLECIAPPSLRSRRKKENEICSPLHGHGSRLDVAATCCVTAHYPLLLQA